MRETDRVMVLATVIRMVMRMVRLGSLLAVSVLGRADRVVWVDWKL